MTVRHRLAHLAAVGLACGALLSAWPAPVGADPRTGVTVAPTQVPAYPADAPDPDVVQSGSTYFAFSTGTSLASYLQVLCNSSGSAATGWAPCPGFPFGASALPSPPSWQALGTQNAPGVYLWGGTWIMFYTAAPTGHRGDTGFNCLSVATTSDLTPTSPSFTDTSTSPLLCDAAQGGAIDPMPFVDPATNLPYLLWKSNSGVPGIPAQLWSQQLGADGMTLVGVPHLLQTQDTVDHPFETTIENPQLVDAAGTYVLVFSTGDWNSSSYGEVAVPCAGPLGPCEGPSGGPFLTSYGSVAGPGGGMFFRDEVGNWQLAYGAWDASCTGYRCGGSRRLFVAPASIEPFPLAPPVTGMASTPDGTGYWLVDAQGGVSTHGSARLFGGMLGLTLNRPIEHLVPTPDGAGYWLVASDGGVFAFGDAAFLGSMGGRSLQAPVVGIATDPATGGYWLVASDGGVFAYGAPFLGSTGARTLNRPVVGMAATTDGNGYWFVATDGGVFAFGNAGFHGSAGALPLVAPVTGMAADPATGGYWLVASDGGVFAYGAPFLGAD